MLTEAFDALQNLLTMVLTPRKTDELDWNRDIPDVKNYEKFTTKVTINMIVIDYLDSVRSSILQHSL